MDNRSFLNKAGPLVAARLVTALMTLSIPLVLARVMNLADYGTYKQLFLVSHTLYLIVPFGVAQSLYFFIPRSEQRRPYFGNALIFLGLGGALTAVGLWIFTPQLARAFSNPAIVEYRWQLALYSMCFIASNALEIGLTSQGKTKQSAFAYLAYDSVRSLAMVLPVLFGYGLRGAMDASVAVTALRWAVTWSVLLKGENGPWFNRQILWQQLAYAAPFGAAMLLAIPQQNAHQYAVSATVSPEMFALYAVGCFQLPIVELLYTPTSEVLMVRIGELEKMGRVAEAAAAFREAVARLSFLFFPMAAFLIAAAPEFIGALFGQRFLPAVPLFRVSACGVFLAILPMDGVLRARNETRHIFLSYLVKALVTIPLVYFGIKQFGMLGGVVSWAVAELVGKTVLFLRVPHALSTPEERVSFRQIIPWARLGQASLAAAIAGVTVFALRATLERLTLGEVQGFWGRAIPLGAASLLFGVGYIVVLRMTGVRVSAVLAGLRWRRAG